MSHAVPYVACSAHGSPPKDCGAAAAKPKPRTTVWHMEPVAANGSADLIAHARGESRSEVTARPPTTPAAQPISSSIWAATRRRTSMPTPRRARRGWLRRKQGGRPPNPYVEFLLAGPPQYSDERRWPDEKELAWAKAARERVDKRFPDSRVVVAALHCDEAAPHVHVVLSPATTIPRPASASTVGARRATPRSASSPADAPARRRPPRSGSPAARHRPR